MISILRVWVVATVDSGRIQGMKVLIKSRCREDLYRATTNIKPPQPQTLRASTASKEVATTSSQQSNDSAFKAQIPNKSIDPFS